MLSKSRQFGTSAEVSVRHFGTDAELSGLGMLKSFFSWKSIIVCLTSIFLDYHFLSGVTRGWGEGADHLGQVTLSRSDAAVEVGGGKAGLQRRRLHRPAPHAASNNSHLFSHLVNRPFMNGIHLYPAGRPASLPHTTSQSVAGNVGEGGQEQRVVNSIWSDVFSVTGSLSAIEWHWRLLLISFAACKQGHR